MGGGRNPKKPHFPILQSTAGTKNFLHVVENGFPSLDIYSFWVWQRHKRPLGEFKYNFSSIFAIFRLNTAL